MVYHTVAPYLVIWFFIIIYYIFYFLLSDELSQPYKDYSIDKDGFLENSQGTMGPRDLTPEGLKSKGGRGPKMALYVHPKIRKKVRKMSKL